MIFYILISTDSKDLKVNDISKLFLIATSVTQPLFQDLAT